MSTWLTASVRLSAKCRATAETTIMITNRVAVMEGVEGVAMVIRKEEVMVVAVINIAAMMISKEEVTVEVVNKAATMTSKEAAMAEVVSNNSNMAVEVVEEDMTAKGGEAMVREAMVVEAVATVVATAVEASRNNKEVDMVSNATMAAVTSLREVTMVVVEGMEGMMI
jgi:hypothetical protein